MGDLVTGLTLRLLPAHERETVLGDLQEEGVRRGSAAFVRALLGVALHYQLEGWRDERGRLGATLSLTLGLALWWAVTAAGVGWGDDTSLYRDPLSRLAARFWSASHLPGAIGAGLLVGHAPWVPEVARPTRWHVAALLAAVAWWTTPGGSTLAPPLLLLAAWFGDRGRDARPWSRV